ncbi:MAG: class I mannose-6-phosphate isomerase [Verrucomicrobia bacterium]|nr:class I mannose-6-phosphate isomerase [Verrucomicrobiota bacterium]
MERVWGGRKLESQFGRRLPVNAPIGESWELVDRPNEQSLVAEGDYSGLCLHDLWQNFRTELFGEGYKQERFPVLIKILDASQVLSVQVHPPEHQADALRGDPKSELWYFADAAEDAGIYIGLKRGITRDIFESALTEGTLANVLHRLPTRVDGFVLIPSGRLHAIDSGNVIFEIQQNSDTTYRVFDWNRVGLDGKPRQLHVRESLASIDFEDHEPKLDEPQGEMLIDCVHFRVDRWLLNEAKSANTLPQFSIFQVVRGIVSVEDRGFSRGDSFLVPACEHETMIRPESGSSLVLRTTMPVTDNLPVVDDVLIASNVAVRSRQTN